MLASQWAEIRGWGPGPMPNKPLTILAVSETWLCHNWQSHADGGFASRAAGAHTHTHTHIVRVLDTNVLCPSEKTNQAVLQGVLFTWAQVLRQNQQ